MARGEENPHGHFGIHENRSRDGRRILVIDDEPAIADLIRAVLSRRGYQVVTSEGGEDALQEAMTGGYELVISDYAIPGLNGLEFARRLNCIQPETRVLIVSAFLDYWTVEELESEPNVVGLVRKPFDIFELSCRVDEQLGMASPHGSSGPLDPAAQRADLADPEIAESIAPPFLDPGAFH